jgi:hypothetical protein
LPAGGLDYQSLRPNSQFIRVHCYGSEGAGQNNNFSFTFMRNRSILGTTAGRYACGNSEGGFNQQFNSTGGIGGAIQFTTHDDWQIPFLGEPDPGPFFVMATPLARARTICAAANFVLAPGNPSLLTGRTECFGATPGSPSTP